MTSRPPAPTPPAGGGDSGSVSFGILGIDGPGGPDVAPLARRRPWLVRRLFPLIATAGLIAIGMITTTWGPLLVGRHAWGLPDDLWGTLVAAQRLIHLDLGGLYTQPTALITLPGAAVILVPVVAVIEAAGLPIQVQSVHYPYPAAWLLAGPYEIALSAVALFAADAIAEHLGVSRWKRAMLAVAGAVALWNVSVRWGHPEDAVAVGLLLFGILALARGGPRRAAWLIGAAVAVQPLVLLALPIVLALVPARQLAGFLVRAAVPGALVLGAAAVANWSDTVKAVTSQPNWPTIDHPTPWISLAPRMSGGAVAAGTGRVLAIVVACGCAVVLWRWWRVARNSGEWSAGTLAEVVWWAAAALALRSLFEPVMVAFYLWPTLAIALLAASRSWPRLVATAAVTTTLTFVSQASWRGPWLWWGLMVAGLGLTLFCARVRPDGPACARARDGE